MTRADAERARLYVESLRLWASKDGGEVIDVDWWQGTSPTGWWALMPKEGRGFALIEPLPPVTP